MAFSAISTRALIIQRKSSGSVSRGPGAAQAPAFARPPRDGHDGGLCAEPGPAQILPRRLPGTAGLDADCGAAIGRAGAPAALGACPGCCLPPVLPVQAGGGRRAAVRGIELARRAPPCGRVAGGRAWQSLAGVTAGGCAPLPGRRLGFAWAPRALLAPGRGRAPGRAAARAMGFMEAPPCGAVGCKGGCIAGEGAPRRRAAAVATVTRTHYRARRLVASRRGRRGARRAGDGRGVVRRDGLRGGVRRGRHDGRVRVDRRGVRLAATRREGGRPGGRHDRGDP